MKVVLFCGGLGMRLRDYSDQIPKPLVPIGPRPIMWHLMKYYAHYGHKDFILCLGYRGDAIKNYFLKYDETVSNDFVLSDGGRKVDVLQHDISDWKITFVETGLHSSIGMRLRAVRQHLEGEEMFLANYSDGLCDLDLDRFVADFKAAGKTASFLSVPAPYTFHIVQSDVENHVTRLEAIGTSHLRVNGGFFALRREIFNVLQENEDLVSEPFERLIAKRELLGVPYDGFWRSMDTFKDRMNLEELWGREKAPWKVWNR
ncbi:MAG: sugar phosphate nucleotidyltransferase [Polyangia bacterium]